jgi:hypothetical protein
MDDGVDIRPSPIDLGMDKALRRRQFGAVDELAVEPDDRHIGPAQLLRTAGAGGVFGLDDDGLRARDAGATVPEVVHQAEVVQDRAGFGDLLSLGCRGVFLILIQ